MAKAGTLGRLAASWAGVPILVHTFHGHLLEGYFSPPVTALYRWVERWLGRRTSHFIAISPEIAGDLERLGIPRSRVSVIRLGLDLERFTAPAAGTLRAGLGIPAGAPLVGIVGRLVPIKAHGLFLAAAAELLKEVPDAHFAIVGDGELWDALLAEVKARSLEERVHFTGWRRDLEHVYPDLQVVVCCSVNEGTPVSVIEAGAAGRPVVGTRVGGMADVISDGVNGLLVPSGDAPALARAVASIILDPERGGRFGEAGRRMALDAFGADRMIRELGDVYQRLLRDSQPLKDRR
jgi:glycosyltransferase involved in cell wall biosynthesis